MGAFLRSLSALGALLALGDLLLPEGGLKRTVRWVVGLMATALLIGAFELLPGVGQADARAVSASVEALTAQEEAYRASALQALARQAANVCERMARNAGYGAHATVALRADGALEHIRLTLSPETALLSPEMVAGHIAEHFQTERERVVLLP